MPQEGWDLIDADDGPFKSALDQTKYASRYQDVDAKTECSKAADFLMSLDNRLQGQTSLFLGTEQPLPIWRSFPFHVSSPTLIERGLMPSLGPT